MAENSRENKKKRQAPRIRSLTHIRNQLIRTFDEARHNELETQDMARFGAYLNILAGVIRDSDIEERLTKIEEFLKK